MDVGVGEPGVFTFESFRIDPLRRVVTCDGVVLNLTARLFDILLYLARNHDRVVDKNELQREVWGDRTMDATNLPVAISSLRKELQGDEQSGTLIVTLPGQGYRLAANVTFEPYAAQPCAGEGSAPRLSVDPPAGASRRRDDAVTWLGLCLVAALFSAVWRSWPPSERTRIETATAFAPPPHSIAVLAFANASGDPAQAYFSDGLAEEFINRLCQIHALHVVARASSFSFKGKSTSVQDIARRLNVGAVLQGSVRRDGSHVVVSVRLFDAQTNRTVWSHSYDRDGNGILILQQELADAVVSSLQVTLAGPDIARLTRGGTANPRALDAYLRSIALRRAGITSEVSAQQEKALLDEAIALDPSFAVAQAYRAYALWAMAATTVSTDRAYINGLKDAALAGAKTAITLAPDLAWAHVALGFAMGARSPNVARQEAEFARAYELAPGDQTVVQEYARMERFAGHEARAVAATEQAVALDPLQPGPYINLATAYYYARRPADALLALRHARELGYRNKMKLDYLTGMIALMQNHPDAARLACADDSHWQMNECLAVAYHVLAQHTEAAAQLAKLRARFGDSAALCYATIYAQWGETDLALHWLDAAYKIPDIGLLGLKSDPMFDPIASNPHVKEIENRLGFPS